MNLKQKKSNKVILNYENETRINKYISLNNDFTTPHFRVLKIMFNRLYNLFHLFYENSHTIWLGTKTHTKKFLLQNTKQNEQHIFEMVNWI